MLDDFQHDYLGISVYQLNPKTPPRHMSGWVGYITDVPEWPEGKGGEGHDEWEAAHTSFYFKDRPSYRVAHSLCRILRRADTASVSTWPQGLVIAQLPVGKQILICGVN